MMNTETTTLKVELAESFGEPETDFEFPKLDWQFNRVGSFAEHWVQPRCNRLMPEYEAQELADAVMTNSYLPAINIQYRPNPLNAHGVNAYVHRTKQIIFHYEAASLWVVTHMLAHMVVRNLVLVPQNAAKFLQYPQLAVNHGALFMRAWIDLLHVYGEIAKMDSEHESFRRLILVLPLNSAAPYVLNAATHHNKSAIKVAQNLDFLNYKVVNR